MGEIVDRLMLEFSCRGTDGSVLVRYGVNDDRARWGFPLLGDAAVANTDGFPVCEAVVTCPVDGYGAYLGWLQVLDIVDAVSQTTETLLDLPPMYGELATPFISFGPEPRFFDAPAIETSDPVRLEWTATTYLCAAGDVLMTPAVRPVAAFSWGFAYEPGQPVVTREPTIAPSEGWDRHRNVVADRLPGWTVSESRPGHRTRAL